MLATNLDPLTTDYVLQNSIFDNKKIKNKNTRNNFTLKLSTGI
jgi:hypothetical protein